MVKQKGGYYKGKKKTKRWCLQREKRQRQGVIINSTGKRILNEFAKARRYFTNMVKKGVSKANKKIKAGGIVSQYRKP